MPVFFFALVFVPQINWANASLIFFILHLLIYPSSNGYNSFMDKDEESIGGIAKPMQPTQQLFHASILLDALAIILSAFISWQFVLAILIYILFSRLYSYRGIRLKQYPIIGYLTVILNQGATTFFAVYHGASRDQSLSPPMIGLLASTLLIGGFYPITQIYQHASDAKDNVQTISMMLGKKGTFVFCGLLYALSFTCLFIYFQQQKQLNYFFILQLFFIPVVIYFLRWVWQVWQNENAANFANTMRMNWIASICTNLAFITLLILKQLG
jgi:1,4-dihydroxy-2-naphthoate polyprenyltransferase